MQSTEQINVMAEKRLNLPAGKKKRVGFIILIALLSFVIVVCAAYICYVQMFPNVFYGVSMGDFDFSGKTPEQTNDIIDKWTQSVGDQLITIKYDGYEVSRSYGQLVIDGSLSGIADTIISVGRSDGFFGNIATVTRAMLSGFAIQPSLELDEDAIKGFLSEFVTLVSKQHAPSRYEIDGDILSVYAGASGVSVDVEATLTLLMQKLASPDENYIEPIMTTTSVEVDAQKIYNEVHREPKNAELLQKLDGTFDIIPEEVGLDFDLDKLKDEMNGGSGETYVVPLVITMPAITSGDLVGSIFRDVLASAKTLLNPGLINRTHNVKLACEAIDGTIIMPGEEFSYNKIVGERTVARGYREAKIYLANEIVDGLGGGICQVSSTLYSCVLHAELEASQRREHMFRVGYVPLGQDATVAWPSIDFRFVNNTDYPIRVDAIQKSDYVYIELRGTIIEPKPYEVKIVSETLSSTPYENITRIDPLLSPGQKRVEQVGSNGYKVTTYRLHMVDGKEVNREYIHTSNYKPANHIIYVSPQDADIDPTAPIDPNAPTDTTDSIDLNAPTDPTTPPDPNTTTQPTIPPTGDTTLPPDSTTGEHTTVPTSGVDDSMTTPPDTTAAPPPDTNTPETTAPPG